jgi:hypothetical protein
MWCARAQVTERESPSREHASGEFQTARMRSSEGVSILMSSSNQLGAKVNGAICKDQGLHSVKRTAMFTLYAHFLRCCTFISSKKSATLATHNACLDTDAKSPGLQVKRTKSDNRNRCRFDETYNGKRWKCVTVEFPAGSMLVHDMQDVTGYDAVYEALKLCRW